MKAAALSLLAGLLALPLGGCSSVQPLPGLDALASAKVCLTDGRYEDAQELAESVIEPDDDSAPANADLEEALFVAAEAERNLGEDLAAYRHYKQILENHPWSPHTAVIEQRLFDIGMDFLYADRYGGWFDARARGVEVLQTLQIQFSQSDKADDALRHIADYYASDEEQEWLEASRTYEQLYRDYPGSEWAERSLWLAGHYRLRLVKGPTYNRDGLLKAAELLELSLSVHPRGVAAADAAADLETARDLLSRGELAVADFYAGRGVPPGERVRLANAALLYPDTEAGKTARARLEALGLDLDAIAADPGASSVDKAVSGGTEWEGS